MPNIFNEAVEQDPMMLKFIPGQSMTQKMWKKALDRSPFIFKYCLERYKTRNMFKNLLILIQ